MRPRGYYFGAGPAVLPELILKEAQAALLNWDGLGLSILEVGHRTEAFKALCVETEQLCRDLLNIPDDYAVLWISGPARLHFSMIPLNFIKPSQSAGYLISGLWSKLAYEEAARLSRAYCFEHINQQDTAYFYYTANETIEGVQYREIPFKSENIPIVSDMTSCLLTAPLKVSDYALIFAGVQKNIAPAGLTLVIVKKSWISREENSLPRWLDYAIHEDSHSLYATPATFQYYMANRMFHWIQSQGGVSSLYLENQRKSAKLYDYLDQSDHFYCPVDQKNRSMLNVIIRMHSLENELKFLNEAETQGLYGLAGHRYLGGIRASLYNAMPYEGVEALIHAMDVFSKRL